MAVSYGKLFSMLKDKGHSGRYWLQQNGIHPATISKMQKGQRVNTDTISALCRLLGCQPGDIMEYVEDDAPASSEAAHQQ